MNFHLKNGIYFRKNGEELAIVKATSFDDLGETIVTMTMADLASVVSSASKCGENGASFGYVLDFLVNGTIRCGGCGNKIEPELVGQLGVLQFAACPACYEQKFKPLFDWGMKSNR